MTTSDRFTCAVLKNGEHIVVSIGGTGSGKEPCNALKMLWGGVESTKKQLFHNFNQAIREDYIPVHFEQAANFTSTVKAQTDHEVSVAGHSLGGGLSSYAAAMAGTADSPMMAHCYNSVQLGKTLLESIANKKCTTLEEAKRLISKITHFTIKGDPTDQMQGLGNIMGDISLLGKAYELEPKVQETNGVWSWIKQKATENLVGFHINYQFYWNQLAQDLGFPCVKESPSPLFASTPPGENATPDVSRLPPIRFDNEGQTQGNIPLREAAPSTSDGHQPTELPATEQEASTSDAAFTSSEEVKTDSSSSWFSQKTGWCG